MIDEKSLALAVGIFLGLSGILFIYFRAPLSAAIISFYRNYPIIRLASSKQFELRPYFVSLLGFTLILLGFFVWLMKGF